ncbi:MAG: tetratricopeptide repeat protein, partial [Acidobacteriota bacterium]|nr:tetratricopeptide repeat protein [Acidobacteriota bacterium]
AHVDSIAVLPFENKSAQSDSEYLADGLTESLIYRLSQFSNLKVSPRSSTFRYKGKDIDPIKAGTELDVNAVLSGRIVQHGDDLTISAELTDVRNNKQLWGEQFVRKMSDLLATQREIAQEIAEKLNVKVSRDELAGSSKHYTESNEAYQLYLHGRYEWNKRTGESLDKAIDYFNQAIAEDPRFALAYAGLADCYVVPANPQPPKEKMPKAKAAAIRALQIDDTLAEAHTSLARVLAVYDWDWDAAEKEFQRAIELNPRYAVAHQWYGGYSETMGRNKEAISERKRAVELDPFSPIINFEQGLGFYYGREYDKAIEQYKKTLELDPSFPPAYGELPSAYGLKGMYDEAIAGFQKGISIKGSGSEWFFSMSGLGYVYAVSGKKAEALAIINELQRLSERQYVPADRVAIIYAGLGEKDQAFSWLEKAYEEHSFNIVTLRVEPRWDSIRSDPRFAELMRKIRLPQ